MTTMNIPDLASYDLILINSSGGKDSQCMLDVLAMQGKKLGLLDRMVVVHADLGRVEWAGTSALAREQAEHYGLRFEVVSRSQDLLDHIKQRGMFPSSTTRYCTSDHKRGQIGKLVTMLTNEIAHKVHGKVRVLNCMGFRAEESSARAKRLPFCVDDRLTSGSSCRRCAPTLPTRLECRAYHVPFAFLRQRVRCCWRANTILNSWLSMLPWKKQSGIP